MSRYTLDSNILIALERHYPRDFMPSLWEKFEALAEARDICICDAVFDEVNRSDLMKTWIANFPEFVCLPDDTEVETFNTISHDHPGWVRDSRNAADPWVVAHGVREGAVIVTDEKRKPHVGNEANQKIPNVASEFQAKTMNFFEFAKSEGWRF